MEKEKKKKKKGEKKKNEGRRWSTGTRVLETRVPRGFLVHLSFAST